jgi:rhodanese-related sulfurtransferase
MPNAQELTSRYSIAPATGYAGDVTPSTAWRMLNEMPDAILVDVRTAAEWNFVGFPDLSSVGKQLVEIEWQAFPAMKVDAEFAGKLDQQLGGKRDAAVLMICRSGARSAAAAAVMTAAGYANSFNVANGFEGPLDPSGRRGSVAGWKADGLPWRQR